MTAFGAVLELTPWAIAAYLLVLDGVLALLFTLAIRELAMHWHVADDEHLAGVLTSDALPPLSILVTAHGASAATPPEVESYVALEYPRHEVILVSDGIPDALATDCLLYQIPPAVMVTVPTAPVRGYYRSRRYSKLLIIDKEDAGRADALNAAVNAARYPYVLAINTGTVLERDALLRLSRPFLLGKSIAVVAGAVHLLDTAGTRARSGAPGLAARWLRGAQSVESLRVFVFERLGWNRFGGTVDMRGALGLFLRDHVLAVEGYRVSAAGADADLVVRVCRHLYEQGAPRTVFFVPDAVAWAEPVPTRGALTRQRERWHRGLIELLAANRDLIGRPAHGATGMLLFPFLILAVALAPLVELVAYLWLLVVLLGGHVAWGSLGVLALLGPGYLILLSGWAIFLGRSGVGDLSRVRPRARLFLWALIEPLGYRQILLWARLRASWQFVRNRHGWRGRGTPRDLAVGRRDPVSEGV